MKPKRVQYAERLDPGALRMEARASRQCERGQKGSMRVPCPLRMVPCLRLKPHYLDD